MGPHLSTFPTVPLFPGYAGTRDARGREWDIQVLFTVAVLPEEQAPPTHILEVTIYLILILYYFSVISVGYRDGKMKSRL